MARLFVYGELRKKISLLELIGRVPPSEPAALRGYRSELDERVGHPVAIPDPDGVVDGLLLKGLTRVELRSLDEYEDLSAGLQRGDPVSVELADRTSLAYVYAR